jgi:hypothetical protein
VNKNQKRSKRLRLWLKAGLKRSSMLFLTMMSLHSAEHDNGQDKERPEERTPIPQPDQYVSMKKSTLKKEDLPRKKATALPSQRPKFMNEGSFSKVVVAFVVVVTAVDVHEGDLVGEGGQAPRRRRTR